MLSLLKKGGAASSRQARSELLAAAHELHMDAQVLFDENGSCLITNDAWLHMACITDEQARGSNFFSWFPNVNLSSVFGAHANGNGRNVRIETTLSVNAHSQIPVELALVQLDHDGRHHYAATIRDITLRKNREESLIYKSDHDVLTGLPNRSYFFRSVNRWLNQSDHPPSATMLLFDLRHFKEINDVLGTEVGDKVLAIIGERLQTILGEKHLVARLGGDKFCIFAESAASCIQTITQQLARVTKLEMDVRQIKVQCAFNAGIALYPGHGSDARTLFNCADAAMQQAKQNDKEYVVFQAQSNEKVSRHQTLTAQLSEAIRNDDLTLLYQPLVDLESGQADSVEALIRWHHPVYGLLGPSEFLSIAECTHLIRPMTHWAIHRALADARSWNHSTANLRVAINLSAVNMLDMSFAHSIESILKQHANANQLQLEITEDSLMSDPVHASTQLSRFSQLHLPIVIDNFGASYTSLRFLKTLPISLLKIERTFIDLMHQSEKDYNMIESMIHMGHSLGIKMAAIGVESKEQLESLKLMSCDYAQGYYYSKPLSSKELADWLAKGEHSIAV